MGLSFNPSNSKAAEFQGEINLNNISELTENENVTVNEISYDEMISKISESKGISKKEAGLLHPNRANKNNLKSGISTLAVTATKPNKLLEIKIRQQVRSTYRPAIQIFVWVYASGSFNQFIEIEELDLDRKDISTSVSKQFQGKVKAEIKTTTSIWWYINGDFYNNGTTTVTAGVEGGAVVWKGSASISTTSNHYEYWNNSGTYTTR